MFLFWQLTIKTIDDLKIVSSENITLEMYIMQLVHLISIGNLNENLDKEKLVITHQSNDISENRENDKNENVTNQIKNIDQIKSAQKNALRKVFLKNKIPFREFTINSTDEQTLGELFSYFILETSIVGKLSKINPFNQPAVEQVKNFTKKLLS